jgi:hypothetical protein|tara:strand:+ start:199 stop:717 length:519 start_codon:yes stop_codon:yes gene_type:complete
MQQFTIQSEKIRDKLNNLLPSQNVGGIGVELTGSTQIIPIVDLTEIAEGSNLRQDLQTAISLTAATAFDVSNTTSTIINTTGYFRIIGTSTVSSSSSASFVHISITDGTTTKIIWGQRVPGSSTFTQSSQNLDLIVFLEAGDSCTITSASVDSRCLGSTRQIADLNGNLVNP